MVGGYFQARNTSDYIKQAEEAIPWIRFGLGFAAVGLLFSFFGRKWWRIGAVGCAFLLLVWWLLIGGTVL
jgi:hypothetical protein